MRFIVSIFTVSTLAFPLCAAAKVAPATKPVTRPAAAKPAPAQSAEAKANLAVTKAVTALKKEYAEHQKDPNRNVMLKADKRINYGKVRLVMKAANEAGFTQVAFLTQNQQAGEQIAKHGV
jgi:biopolymer transport protein ExbD